MINTKHIDDAKSLGAFFLKNFWGIKHRGVDFMIKRFECYPSISMQGLSPAHRVVFASLCYKVIPVHGFLKHAFMLNIIFLDLLQTYQGWRHFTGKPSRGQRTWSNAWSSFKSNKVLQDYKYKASKAYYGRLQGGDIRILTMAEHMNLLWRNQWLTEWKYSRDIIRRSLRKATHKFHIDFPAIAKGLLGNLRKDNPKVGKKKKKILTGSVGFDPGFTKTYLIYQSTLKKLRRKRRR